jgi:hypothetical protein
MSKSQYQHRMDGGAVCAVPFSVSLYYLILYSVVISYSCCSVALFIRVVPYCHRDRRELSYGLRYNMCTVLAVCRLILAAYWYLTTIAWLLS